MRSSNFILPALAAVLTAWVAPAAALDRPPSPGAGAIGVTRVADLDPAYGRPYRGGYSRWRYQAAYARWLHNEYVVAGYPVNQYRSPTYYWIGSCCARRRHR